ncbi:MAG: hypothetical protein BWX94_01303 [Tenericutes bacterium ADurb.Bin140]|nr:MAG: hypothetical protein BWX94_01303 [Tenericutes bacterium ADurb.Bin140]
MGSERNFFPDSKNLSKTLAIRNNPLQFKNDSETKKWLKTLGPIVQRYADFWEKELIKQELNF